MNYLAHLFLSGSDPEMMLGGLLGDFVKGPLKREWPQRVEQGIRLHREIDAFTDRLPVIQQSVARLGPQMRRVGGIAIDLCYDHFLARHWQQFHFEPLPDYCQGVYRLLRHHHASLPPNAQRFSQRARQYRLLESYAEFEILETALCRIAKRLSRPTPLASCYPHMARHYDQLEADFFQALPQLQDFAGSRLPAG